MHVLMALIAAGTIVWFIWSAWFPVIKEAIRHLPAEGTIESRQLKVVLDPAQPLASSRLLGFVPDPEDLGGTGLTTDFLIQFRKSHIRVCSLLGCRDFPYPPQPFLQFNRPELEPKWDAWEPILLAIAGVTSALLLLASWFALATLYFLPVFFLGYLKDKALTVGGAWRLAAAAQMPGALLLTAGIVCYALAIVDLIGLFSLSVIHFVVGWVYMVAATLALPPKQALITPGNPFLTEDGATDERTPLTATPLPPPITPGGPSPSEDNPS